MFQIAACFAASIAVAVGVLWLDWRMYTRGMPRQEREEYSLRGLWREARAARAARRDRGAA